MAEPVRFVSALQPDAVVQRLRAAVDSPFVPFGKKAVIGSVGDRAATLRKRIKGRNSFQTALRVRILPDIRGTLLECVAGAHPAVLVFITLWLGAVVVIGGMVFVAALADVLGQATSEVPPFIGLLVPPAMFVFGLVLLGVGRKMAAGEDQLLLDFLAETAQARKLSANEAGEATVV